MALSAFIDVETFFADAVFSGATISPDGIRLAYLAPAHGRTQVWIRDLDADHADAVCVTHDERRGVKSYQWTDDPRWMTYLQDTDGNEDWHLWRVDLDDPSAPAVDLTPMPPGCRVLGVTPVKDRPGTLLVSMNPRALYVDAFLVDLATGEQTLLFENDSMLRGAAFGPDLQRFTVGLSDDGAWEARADDGRLIVRCEGAAYPVGVHPLHVTPDGRAIVIGAYVDDDLQLVRCDIATGEQTVLAAQPGRNLCTMSAVAPGLPPTIYTSKRTGELIAARFVGDRPTLEVLDPAYTGLFTALQGLSDGVLSGLASDEAERRWVATFAHDLEPDLAYLYDAETGESRLLGRPWPALDPADLAPMTAVTLKARDGLPLHAFLTLPVGVPAEDLPLVLQVHGGPWCHDMWGWNRAAQLLANRGYAVLQVNFRGSTGYGKRHITAAVGELAGAMHDDLIDAVDWAVEQGIADPERLGIYGGSYGGYATLVAVTFTPDRFAAAVDYVGISSLMNFQGTLPEFVKPTLVNNWLTYAGNPEIPEQAADMLARSPIERVDLITTPLLVIQGANDARVVQAEADNIVEALRARDVPVEYLLAEDEGHGFQNPENLIAMWHAIERHFGTHLGGRTA